jgi:hypothetical protein
LSFYKGNNIRLEHGPTDGTMTNVKGELKVGAFARAPAGLNFLLGIHCLNC